MDYFDLHCDTIYECEKRGQSLRENTLEISLEKGTNLNRWIQTYAVWMPDEFRGTAAVEQFEKVYRYFLKVLANNKALCWITDAETLDSCGARGALLAVEGGSACAGSLEQLERLYRMGVRMMTLTWNGRNELGDGSVAGEGGGLTPFGKQAVHRMEELGMLVDVSHLSDRGFFDVLEETGAPFAATHSNCRALCSHPRNLTDEQLTAVFARGGLVGINFYPLFLTGEKEASLEDIHRHIGHMLSLGGEDCICIGSDFDGASLPEGIRHVGDIPALGDYLLKRGMEEKTMRKIFFENAYRFFQKVLPKNMPPMV